MRIDFSKIIENRKASAIASVLIAIVLWFAVVLVVDTEGEREIMNVPVRIGTANTKLDNLELKPLVAESEPIKVNVTVSGRRSVIGNLTADDIIVSADLRDVDYAGGHNISFTASGARRRDFNIVSISPGEQEIYFDVWVPLVMDVNFMKDGLVIPDDYIMDSTVLSPETIEIKGPDSILSDIKSCAVSYQFTEPLTGFFNQALSLYFLDDEGSVRQLPSHFISVYNQNGEEMELPGTINVTISVLKRKVLPVTFDLSNTPEGFDLDSLAYILSEPEIALAGPESAVDEREDYSLGSIDIRDIEPGFSKEIEVALPQGYRNLHDIETVNVEFPLTGYETKEFTISGISVLNAPDDYVISTVTRQLKVKAVGPANVLRQLTAADLVAEINMNNVDLVNGQASVEVSVRSKTHNNIWFSGKYSAIIDIKEV